MTNSFKEIEGIHYVTKDPIRISMEDGHISNIEKISPNKALQNIVAPGLVDLQINGYMGIDFNQRALSPMEWDKVQKELAKVGVTSFYPTIITNSIDSLHNIFRENVSALDKGIESPSLINGFHLEGPYISNVDGPRGAHNKKYVKSPDWDEFQYLQEAANGKIKIITLSAEWDNVESFIKKAIATGVEIAIGHTAANTSQIQRAVDAGARISTHLGNGAHLQLPRHPNYIWDQLANETLWSTVIADGHHLPNSVLKVFQKVKENKMILISDSVALAGMPPGNYQQAVGGEVTLTKSGRLHLKDERNLLAGSAQNLLQAIYYLVSNDLTTFSKAIQMGSVFPSRLMNLDSSKGIEVGAPADLILLEKINHSNNQWTIKETYKQGKLITKR